MTLCACVLVDIIHFIKIVVLCNIFFVFRKRDIKSYKLILISAELIIAVTSFAIFVLNNTFIETLIYIIVVISLIYILYKEKLSRIIISMIGIIFALSMIDAMTSVLVDIFFKLFNLREEIISDLVATLISLVIIYVIGSIYKKNTSKTFQEIGYINIVGLTILLCIDTFVVAVIVKQPFVDEDMTNKLNIYLLALIFVIIGIFTQLGTVIILFAQRNVHKEKERILDAYLNEQKNHYEYLENREKETKKFRHDLRNHLDLISNLAKSQEYDKIDNYLEQMNMRINTFGTVVTVHNGIVDAIINQYYMKAKQSGVNMKVEGKFPVDCAIEAYDLCTIFSNVLSNAYEAAVETEEKKSSLVCGYTERNIIIAVENSCRNELSSGGLRWKTQKDNSDYHGYGLENIKDSVKKYDGIFDIEIKDNKCMLKILFNHKKESEVEELE